MNISRKGVDWHRAKICQMLNLKRGMADLIRVAIGFGLTALCLMLACAAIAAPIFLAIQPGACRATGLELIDSPGRLQLHRVIRCGLPAVHQ